MLPTSNRHPQYHYSSSRGRTPSTTAIVILCLLSFLLGKYVDNILTLSSLPIPRIGSRHEGDLAAATNTRLVEGTADTTRTGAVDAQKDKGQENKEAVQRSILEDNPELARLHRVLSSPLADQNEGRDHYTTYPYQIVSWHPRAQVYPNFLTDEECDHIVKIGERRLAPSQLALKKGDDPNKQKDVRTSSGTFLTKFDDKDGVLARIEERIAEVTMIPAEHGEAFNLLRYENGQHYDSHYDLFRQEDYGPQKSNRIATVLLYLSTPEDGGETIFPLEGKDGLARKSLPDFSYKDCKMGLKVKPVKGMALLFWSLHPDGTYDDSSLHGGCPTWAGTKWVITKWIRTKPGSFGY